MAVKTKDALDNAEKKARLRELEQNINDFKTDENVSSILGLLESITGEQYGPRRKKQNSNVAFDQRIIHNVEFLTEHKYLTLAEKGFLWDLAGFLEWNSNCIVEKQETKKTKKEKMAEAMIGDNSPPKTATVSYISRTMGLSRQRTSDIMNSLKEKGVLATADTGMITENGRTCTSRTWFVNPNILYIGDKNEIDMGTQRIFMNSLKFIIDKNGKKLKLPVRLFL